MAASFGGLAGTALAVRMVVVAGDPGQGRWRLLIWIAVAWAAFCTGVWGVRRTPQRVAVPLILIGGMGLQLVAMSSPPRLTDDFFRYAWDGRVQAAGVSPYRYPPTDPALARLRTPWLFPPDCSTQVPVCTRMNHPGVPTIYPPVAQAEFTAVHLLTRPLGPDGGRERTWQALAAVLATVTSLALIRLLQRVRGDPRQAVLWAWCPTVVLEGGGNAHVDVLASLLVVLALAAAVAGRRVRSGVLIGAAIGTKLLPVLVLVALAGPLPVDGSRGSGGTGPGPAGWWPGSQPRPSARCTCRTCWPWARGCSASCPGTCLRRASTGAPAFPGSRWSCPGCGPLRRAC